MSAGQLNALRVAAILRAREFKTLFLGAFGGFVARLVPASWWTRLLFRTAEGALTIAGERVLADLRDFAGLARQSNFDPDPHVMAYREGKRAVVMRIIHHLNLDEAQVQQMIGVDDGV